MAATWTFPETMDDLEVQVEVLSEHVTRLEGMIDVMLQGAENGTLEQAAASIRALTEVEDE